MFPRWGPIVLYDLLQLIAYLAAAWIMHQRLGQFLSIPRRTLRVGVLASALVFLYGGALIPYLWTTFHQQPVSSYLASGRYFHSVFLTILLYLIAAFKLLRLPLGKGLDAYMIAAMAASAIGRIGCFMQGCCLGKPTGLPWGLEYPTFPGVRLHPTQLYMLFVETALLFFLIRFNRKKQWDGQTFWVGVWLYSAYRILIEIVRTNPVFFWGLSHAHAFSILTLAFASWVLLRRRQTAPHP